MNSNIQAAAEKLLLENYESYYRLAYSYVRNESDALDIVQESACRAITECGSVKNPEYLSTWLYRIVINTALDFIRKYRREETTDSLPDPVWEDRYSDPDLISLVMALDEKSRTDSRALRGQEAGRNCPDLRRKFKYTIHKARLYRALKKLRLDLAG